MRIRYIPVTVDWFLEMCKGETLHGIQVMNPLPPDTRVQRTGHDCFGMLNIVIESETFENVEEGAEIPMHPRIMFQKRDDLRLPEGL